MDTLHRIWAGLDVHKDTVVACVRRLDDRDRDRVHTEVRTFGTTTAPGISRRTAEVVLAEIGGDMGRFGTAGRLASWGGLCPGNNESAGKRRGGRTTRGDRWLRVALVQAAWAASRARKTYLAARYRRLARRRGQKKALIAVAHTLLVMCYRVLKKGQPYQELWPEYLDRLGPERRTRQLVRRLESLGHKVTLEPKAVA